MRQAPLPARLRLLRSLLAAALLASCAHGPKSGPGGPCARPRDCGFGLECRAGACERSSYGDCQGDGPDPATGRPQCLSGERCAAGRCVAECVQEADCRAGETCRIGLCQREGRGKRACASARDCAGGSACVAGQCAAPGDAVRCSGDADCSLGARCLGNRCL